MLNHYVKERELVYQLRIYTVKYHKYSSSNNIVESWINSSEFMIVDDLAF